MNTENPPQSTTPSAKDNQTQMSQQSKPSWFSRRKKIIIFVLIACASAFGTLAYLNESPDPTTWESMRTDYKNTK